MDKHNFYFINNFCFLIAKIIIHLVADDGSFDQKAFYKEKVFPLSIRENC